MKEEQIKLIIVLLVAVVAVIGLFMLMNIDLSPAMTGAVVVGSSDSTVSSLSSDTVQVSAEQLPASAGCCNWDCNDHLWTCRTRSMQCSVGKPVFGCRD